MLNRHFNTPDRKSFRATTRLYAGRDARLDLPALLPQGPLIVVADRHFANSDTVTALNPAVKIIVAREPSMAEVKSLVVASRALGATAIVALGGGSTIDTAKALHCALSFPDGTPRDRERPADAPLLIAIPTTAGSGSETSRFFILSDDTGIKCSHRAWSFAPDVAILDPALIAQCGPERLVLGAFDAFIHLWETFVCRNERTPVVDMFALEGMTLIAAAMTQLAGGLALEDDHLMGLQRASAYGGYAISNTRTGLIHTLGESLAPQISLGHPETLYVFFEQAIVHYRQAVEPQIARLDRQLAGLPGTARDFESLYRLWRTLFDTLGITARIQTVLHTTSLDIARLCDTAARDVVLPKENPALLTPKILRGVIDAALVPEHRAQRAGVKNC